MSFRIYDSTGLAITGRRLQILTGGAEVRLPSRKRTAYLRRWAPFRVEGDLPKRLRWVANYRGGTAPRSATIRKGRRIKGQSKTVDAVGVGTELKALLESRYGITSQDNCQCNQRAEQMDRHGIAWCEQNAETIVGWLLEGAASRMWMRPLVALLGGTADKLARSIVRESIHRAKIKRDLPRGMTATLWPTPGSEAEIPLACDGLAWFGVVDFAGTAAHIDVAYNPGNQPDEIDRFRFRMEWDDARREPVDRTIRAESLQPFFVRLDGIPGTGVCGDDDELLTVNITE